MGNFWVRWATVAVVSFGTKKTQSSESGDSEFDHAQTHVCQSAARGKGAAVMGSGMPDGDVVVVSPLSRRRPRRAATPPSRPPVARIEAHWRFHERAGPMDKRPEMGSCVFAWERDEL